MPLGRPRGGRDDAAAGPRPRPRPDPRPDPSPLPRPRPRPPPETGRGQGRKWRTGRPAPRAVGGGAPQGMAVASVPRHPSPPEVLSRSALVPAQELSRCHHVRSPGERPRAFLPGGVPGRRLPRQSGGIAVPRPPGQSVAGGGGGSPAPVVALPGEAGAGAAGIPGPLPLPGIRGGLSSLRPGGHLPPQGRSVTFRKGGGGAGGAPARLCPYPCPALPCRHCGTRTYIYIYDALVCARLAALVPNSKFVYLTATRTPTSMLPFRPGAPIPLVRAEGTAASSRPPTWERRSPRSCPGGSAG